MTAAQDAVLLLAATTAGVVNSIAGGGTLITFPALVWAGYDPIVANATNTVTLWPGSLAATIGFRQDLGRARRWMVLLAMPSVVGGAMGALLLLNTPSKVFAALVPWLILGATVVFALQVPITRWLTRRRARAIAPATPPLVKPVLCQLAIAVYGGYFGAGIGIMMLAALGLLGLTDLHEMVGLRNFLAVLINGVAALYFALSGIVSWPVAGLMVVGQIAGGYGGSVLARRLGQRFVRRFVVTVGASMAISLLAR